MFAVMVAVAAVVASSAASMALGWVPAPTIIRESPRRAAALAVGLVLLVAVIAAVGIGQRADSRTGSSAPAPPTVAPGSAIDPPRGVLEDPLSSEQGLAVAAVAGLPGSVDGWADVVRVTSGATVSVLVFFRNGRDSGVDHVLVRLSVPAGVQVLEDGVMLVNGNYPYPAGFVYPTGQRAILSSGVDIGSYGPGGTGYVRVRMAIPTGNCGQRRYAFGASVTVGSASNEDAATVDAVAPC